MRPHVLPFLIGAALATGATAAAQDEPTFTEYRAMVAEYEPTRAAGRPTSGTPLPAPPEGLFEIVRYDSDVGYQTRPGDKSTVGALGAYMTPDPDDGVRRPAIVWLTGGETNTLGEVWGDQPWENDQTAAAYREAGVVMMFPSLRGGNDNPGRLEGFVGEVDDVLAATAYLRAQPHVDPNRVYLGGHSSGGTLALLVAATDTDYAGVIAFGPVASPYLYPDGMLGVSLPRSPDSEMVVRTPAVWLKNVEEPMLIIEGSEGNADQLDVLRENTPGDRSNISYVAVPGAGHFDVLAPANAILAERMMAGGGIAVTAEEVAARKAAGE